MARCSPSRRFILDLGEWGFAVPFYSVHCRSEFSLLKQVKEINAYCFLCYATRHKKRYYCGNITELAPVKQFYGRQVGDSEYKFFVVKKSAF